ncbi:sulfide:quinone oxidoreductase, mitochondrial [Sitophilus oryzae]|uniref:Sulfide:quinone oxidoreductase, mitochondrial n=1 Tax=Sitophilus oryzae TaxID=7048 RepID=A0A6J2YR16_SITOR|nr:sulfide:quinone oxidoreductase, mitochondrial [Sitophilus oryzae]
MLLRCSKSSRKTVSLFCRYISSSSSTEKHSCKVLVVGGGTGGCALTAKFSRTLKKSDLIIIEPSSEHYYQPLFTLVGAGIDKIEDTKKNEKDILPENCTWIKQKAAHFDLNKNIVTTANGSQIEYDYLVVSTGIIPRYEMIPGLVESLQNPKIGVCSIYSLKYVQNVFPTMQTLKSGNAIFTFPASPVKCPGAPQKICYLTDDYLRKEGKRDNVNIIYNTSLPVIFGVKKYADALWKICKERNITVNTRKNLISINPQNSEATFQNLDQPEEKTTISFSMLHVVPPMSTTESVRTNKELCNEAGFVEVDKSTLQHVRFPNVFALGDCSSSPNSKTAAAAAAQTEVVFENLEAVMKGKKMPLKYDGYASCPLVTGYNKCILAEFDYDLNPLETFPFSQDRELWSMFILKKNVIPTIYWSLMMNGHWNGPALFRRIMHLDLFKKRQ